LQVEPARIEIADEVHDRHLSGLGPAAGEDGGNVVLQSQAAVNRGSK
jgi:hypothetical protein